MHCQRGSVLLFMIGLLTVMLIMAYSYVTTIEITRGTSQFHRRKSLARLAADMGMQHAIAVCMHEYAMTDEIKDGTAVPARSTIDAPHKNVFGVLSPRIRNSASAQQPPLPWDLSPDVSFQDLMWGYHGTYHNLTPMNLAFADGWTMDLGYARIIEANRFDYVSTKPYDPASYRDYNLAPLSATPPMSPDPSPVSSPFPPVDPFIPGRPISARHDLDHPMWMDANYRPVNDLAVPSVGPVEARYRLRYAVNVEDMSPALWLNTDMPWVPLASRQQVRSGYAESIASIGTDWRKGTVDYSYPMESIFRGYGQYGNSRFDPSIAAGIPLEWVDRGGVPMWYRSPQNTVPRAFHSVHGGPFATWNDPDPSNPMQRLWIGSALPSWNDLTFALQGYNVAWHMAGESRSYNRNRYGGFEPVRADPVGQRVTTPFGRPYAAATDNPWAINALNAPMKVIESMVVAYLPPAVRSTWTAAVNSSSVMVMASTVQPGPGSDLFTNEFIANGRRPFAAYPTPSNRNYWTSPSRTNMTVPTDARTNAVRYPGSDFFPCTKERRSDIALFPAVWVNTTADPKQLGSSNYPGAFVGYDPYVDTQVNAAQGIDHLAHHIAFYDPSVTLTAGNNTGILSARIIAGLNPKRWWVPQTQPLEPVFTPMQPFGSDGYNLGGIMNNAMNGNAWENRGAGGCAFLFAGHDSHRLGTLLFAGMNSYWNRLALAYVHAIVVSQIANLAWAAPQDARNQSFWPTYANNNMPAGIIYTTTPSMPITAAMRKNPTNGWNPAAAHFASEEMLDRQFLANLGENFDRPGRMTTSEALVATDQRTGAPRPPRFSICITDKNAHLNDISSPPGPETFAYGAYLHVGEYRITNNIRTLLTPIDTTTPATLTALSTDAQAGNNAPPQKLWLLDELNGNDEAGYTPGTTVGLYPTKLARSRAKHMELLLNDWRLSFLGSVKAYAPSFRPKDFDGDGKVFCSGYMDATGGIDADSNLACWQVADADGNGPGIGSEPSDPANGTPAKQLSLFSVTGCMGILRSHQYRIRVRGELFDNNINSAVSEQYLESAILIDPDNDVVRSGLPTGLTDTTIMMQRPIHNYYRGYLSRSYP